MPPKVDILEPAAPRANLPPCPGEPIRMPVALLLLAKPGIIIAEMLAGVAGALLAAPSPSPSGLCLMLLLIALGAGGAAMANCLMEERADRAMQRLSRRCRALESAGRCRVAIMATVLSLAAILLAALVNSLTLLLLLAASSIYIFVYTGWLKRLTPWSVLAGGIPGALPPLIGAAATGNSLPAPALLLTAMIYLWQLPHFWFLALHCRGQYRLAGIPVLPLSHGVAVARRFTLCATLALVPASLVLSRCAAHGRGLALILLILALSFSLFSYDSLYRKSEYHRGFIGSLAYMAILLMVVIIGAIQGTLG